jgi:hypothetical protein
LIQHGHRITGGGWGKHWWSSDVLIVRRVGDIERETSDPVRERMREIERERGRIHLEHL